MEPRTARHYLFQSCGLFSGSRHTVNQRARHFLGKDSKSMFHYKTHPIDWFEGVQPLRNIVLEEPSSLSPRIAALLALMDAEGPDSEWISEPYCTFIPDPAQAQFALCIVRKEENNGTTHVVSEIQLQHLSEFWVNPPPEDPILVHEEFSIDEDLLHDRVAESDYWDTAYTFYLDIKDKPFSSITPKQKAWLTKIEDEL